MALPQIPPSHSAQTPSLPNLTGAFLRLAALMLLVYAALAVFYSTPALSQPRINKELMVWPVTFLLLWGYWRGYILAKDHSVPRRWILLSGLGLAVLAALVPPFHSTDMFGYVNRGWQQAHYHLNPYVYTVNAIPHWENDPMITNHWVNNPSPYGFLYLLVAKGLCLLGHGDKSLTLAWFKLGNFLMHLLTAGLIWMAAKYLNESPRSPYPGKIRPELALYVYLWNPLILINTLANGHNDIYMGFFVTLSALFALTGAWLWVLPSLMAATLMKYGAVVIFPIATLFLIKNKAWKALAGGLLICLGLFWISGQPFLPEWQQFHLSEINHNAFVSHGSLHSLLFIGFKTLVNEAIPAWTPYLEPVRSFLKNSLLLAYVAFCVRLLWVRTRQNPYIAATFIRDALMVMALLVCVVSLKFYPWYLSMFFPLALFLPDEDGLRHWLLVVSGAQLFSITFIGQAHLLNFIVMTALPTAWVIWQRRKCSKLAALPLQPPLDLSAALKPNTY
jgi:alpha-1,6-mannosyltransferase